MDYEDFQKTIDLTYKYSETENLDKIIKYCNLFIPEFDGVRPYSFWHDAYGLSLKIPKSKNIIINKRYMKRSVDRDIYAGISLDNCLKITNKICIIYGDDDLNIKYRLYSCFCIDNTIRSYFYYNNKVIKCSPLNLGYSTLSSFINSINKFGQVKSRSKILDFNKFDNIVIDNYPLTSSLDNL